MFRKEDEIQSKTLDDTCSDKESDLQFLKRRRMCATTQNCSGKTEAPLSQPITRSIKDDTSDCHTSDESPYFPSTLISEHYVPKKRCKHSTLFLGTSNITSNCSSSPEPTSNLSFNSNNENSINQSSQKLSSTIRSENAQSDRKLENDVCCFVSPIPLPPVYLNLPFPSCSSVLQEALKKVWVSSEDAASPPIGYIRNSLPEQSRFNLLSPINVFSNGIALLKKIIVPFFRCTR
jgi:hypothetical protein